jgi:hypothetical protein
MLGLEGQAASASLLAFSIGSRRQEHTERLLQSLKAAIWLSSWALGGTRAER